MKALVLGIGNILLGDEGIGVMAVEELQSRYDFSEDIEILDGGTAGLELLPHISTANFLIIIDALRADHPPGTVMRVSGEDVPALLMEKISPHQLGLSDLLAAATLSHCLPPRIALFGIEPLSIATGIGLTDPVKDGMEKLLGNVVEELNSADYKISPKSTPDDKEGFWSQNQ